MALDSGLIIRSNLPDFKKQMEKFSYELQQKIAGSADNAAAQVLKRAVVAAAPILKTPDRRKKNPRIAGTLRHAIYVYRRRNPQPGTVLYSISWRKGKAQQFAKGGSRDAFYGRFLELGWMPRGPGRRLRGGIRAKALLRKRARDAGAKKVSYPFLLPGFRQAQAAAVDAFNRKMQERIDKLNRELK